MEIGNYQNIRKVLGLIFKYLNEEILSRKMCFYLNFNSRNWLQPEL